LVSKNSNGSPILISRFSAAPRPTRINHRWGNFFGRKYLIRALVLVFALGCMAQTAPRNRPAAQARPAPESSKKQTTSFVSKVLANGLEVVVYEDHSVPLVTVEYANKAGSFVEGPAESGFSHLLEHLFFRTNRATKQHEEYVQHLDQLGIVYNGTTKEEEFSAYLTATSNNLTTLLHCLRDAARYPLFLPNEIKNAQDVVAEESAQRSSNPYNSLNTEMTQRLFYKYPNRKDPVGNREVVQQATPEQLRTFWGKYWVPNNSAVIIAGDVKPEEAFARVEQFFGDWPRAGDPFAQFPPVQHPPLGKSAGAILEAPIQDVVVELGWQGPSIGQDTTATYAADVFDFILTQPGSRFQRSLVDSGLATSVNLGYYTQRNVGPISAVMNTTTGKTRAALKVLQNEIAHFSDPGYFSDQDLQNAKTLLSADEFYEREKPSQYAHTLSFWWASTGTEYYKSYHGVLASVTRADVRKYVESYIAGKARVGIVLLSPEAQQQLRLTANEVTGQ
jgi:zinc protease